MCDDQRRDRPRVRASQHEQADHRLQHDALARAGVDRVFEDKMSGARNDRPQLQAMLDYAREGDVDLRGSRAATPTLEASSPGRRS